MSETRCRCYRCSKERFAAKHNGEPPPSTLEHYLADNPDFQFIVCVDCGNKRCPHATDHRLVCTGSNEPGQEGSSYGPPLKCVAHQAPTPSEAGEK